MKLIIETARDLAHLKKEIVALRCAPIDYYAGLQSKLLEIDDLYILIANKIKYNSLDNKKNHKEIKQLIKAGYINKYPFSIN